MNVSFKAPADKLALPVRLKRRQPFRRLSVYLESDERNAAGLDLCNTHAPAETGQLAVRLQDNFSQSSVLSAVKVNGEPVLP